MSRFTPIIYRTAKTCVNALPEWLLRLRLYTIYQIDLRSGPTSASPLPHVSIDWLDLTAPPQSIAQITIPTLLRQAHANNQRAIVAWQGETPVGIVWLATENFCEESLGTCFELMPKESWLFAAHVPIEHRRQGIYRQILAFAHNALQREGMSRILLGVANGNAPSELANTQSGATPIGKLACVKILGTAYATHRGKIERLAESSPVSRSLIRFRVTT